MSAVLWRSVVMAAFAFWQGGFTFYAAVVVPIGTDVLGSPMEQGAVTRRVTVYLNLAGGVALMLFALDHILFRCVPTWLRRARWAAWYGMVITLIVLFWLHPRMIELLDTNLLRQFRGHHRWYLWISTVQWGFGVVYLLCTVSSWRGHGFTQTE